MGWDILNIIYNGCCLDVDLEIPKELHKLFDMYPLLPEQLEITEEIDHHGVEKIRRQADEEITRTMPRKLIFDFNKVLFMDSAGIGMLIGRYKMIKMLGGTIEIINLNKSTKKILEMSGVLKIIPAREETVYGK